MMGLGAMIHHLGGGSPESASKYYGKKITGAQFINDSLILFFADCIIEISDDGQSCCEERYLRTDDDPQDLVGKTLTSIKLKETKSDSDWGVHEITFMEVQAEDACVTFSSHNEHNGYYGGICLSITEKQWEAK